MHITSEQIRAARALLRWEQKDLAEASGVSLPSIKRLEGVPGPLGGYGKTIAALQGALERAGITFTNGGEPGVKLRPFRVGDRVMLLVGTLTWGQEVDLRNVVGEVTDFVDDGTSMLRVNVRFENGRTMLGTGVGHLRRV